MAIMVMRPALSVRRSPRSRSTMSANPAIYYGPWALVRRQSTLAFAMRQTHTRAAALLALLAGGAAAGALAASAAFDALSSKDAAGGLRAALSKGVDVAVTQLGATNGFLNDPKVAIPLPPALDKADHALRMVGLGGEADQLRVTMNHAAEQAVAQAKPIFKQALQRMTLADAKGILTGGDGAGTAYFRRATSEQLTTK